MVARTYCGMELECALIHSAVPRAHVFVHTHARFEATAEQFKAPALNKPTYSIVRLRINPLHVRGHLDIPHSHHHYTPRSSKEEFAENNARVVLPQSEKKEKFHESCILRMKSEE